MQIRPLVSRIRIFPIKSLDGISLSQAQVGPGGCLLHDREFAIFDGEGRVVNGKRNPDIFLLRSKIDFDTGIISLKRQGEMVWQEFHVESDFRALNEYLSRFFGFPVRLFQNREGRFLDIPDIAGITLLSTSSLESVSHWFGDMDLEETRKRFRATIEISEVPAFWEDHLFAEEGMAVEFMLGEVRFLGISPRERCSVPTRDPLHGNIYPAFPKTFARQRAATLPAWSGLEAYGHHYHFTVNCAIAPGENGKWIHTGDELRIIGKREISDLSASP